MPAVDFGAVASEFQARAMAQSMHDDPVLWAQRKCGDYIWSKQREVMYSVRDHKRTLVASCHASGKSFLASRVIGWWVDVHDKSPDETRVVTTAPSWSQVRNIMWAYIETVNSTAHIGGRINGKAEMFFGDHKSPTVFGRKPADYNDDTFQGIHATYTLAVIDEAGGVGENIFTGVETITTNKHARILAIANPDDPSSYMAKVWHEQSRLPEKERDWNLITISAFDTPNFTDEEVPEKLQDNLLQKVWVDDARKRWGTEDPRYVAKVLAKFPDIGGKGLFNLGKVLLSMSEYDAFERTSTVRRLGVDVGLSETGDFSVVVLNDGGKISILDKVKGYDGRRLERLVGDRAKEFNVDEINIDVIGAGRGIQQVAYTTIPTNIPINWIVGNGASPDKLKWYNVRAVMYDKLSDAINMRQLGLPPDEFDPERTQGLLDEFRNIGVDWKGSALLIESKDSIKRHGKHSPDVVDAIAYANLDVNVLTANDDQFVTPESILEETDNEFWADDWGNEPWSFAPA